MKSLPRLIIDNVHVLKNYLKILFSALFNENEVSNLLNNFLKDGKKDENAEFGRLVWQIAVR